MSAAIAYAASACSLQAAAFGKSSSAFAGAFMWHPTLVVSCKRPASGGAQSLFRDVLVALAVAKDSCFSMK